MGFYSRKSMNAGPFRINVAKSGVGASVGVRGFRVGSGPRGTYVHVSAHGLHYRRMLSSLPRAQGEVTPAQATQLRGMDAADETGFDATQLVPTGPGALLDQLSAASRYNALLPWGAIALVLTAGVAATSKLLWMPITVLAAGVPGLVWLWWWDRRKRTVTVAYEVTGPIADWFNELIDGYRSVVALGGAWRVEASVSVAGTYGYKVSGGAETQISRKAVTRSSRPPRILATNIAVPTISHDRHALLFLPDRILVRSADSWSYVDYRHLHVECHRKWVIEPEPPPRDGIQVDTTWQFVNVRGGPDRRYRHNPLLPIMEYGHLTLTSPHGLHWIIDCSRPEVAEWFAAVLTRRPC
ncbi:DUF4236 domain-containing protein [Nocardia suismassiliense]|uniref:DUF4236 domain-containing protein n=1 Tax=Nocardia suismassiliense TaxID=2077092 RepID=A0ABW6QPV2_9NOCA